VKLANVFSDVLPISNVISLSLPLRCMVHIVPYITVFDMPCLTRDSTGKYLMGASVTMPWSLVRCYVVLASEESRGGTFGYPMQRQG
jgi:hypothetical protein